MPPRKSRSRNKKSSTTPATQPLTVNPSTAQSSTTIWSSTAWLTQGPADIFNLVYLYLPWYERLLHVSHVHSQLLPGWFGATTTTCG